MTSYNVANMSAPMAGVWQPSTAEAASKGKKDQTDHMFAEDWFPVQVKQMDRVGRPDIDQFCHVMDRANRQRGFFVAFGFSQDAKDECARYFKQSKRIIKLLTVQGDSGRGTRAEDVGDTGEEQLQRKLDWI